MGYDSDMTILLEVVEATKFLLFVVQSIFLQNDHCELDPCFLL